MEVALAVLACCLSAAGAAQACLVATDGSWRERADVRIGGMLAERTMGALEVLGHRVALIRLANVPRVARAADRVRSFAAERGVALSRYGCVAGLIVACLLAGAAGSAWSRSALGGAVGAGFFMAGVAVAVSRHEEARRERMAAQMPEVLRAFSGALASGRSLSQAVEYVGRNVAEPMGSEFLQASFQIAGGESAEAAVYAVCGRVDVPGMALLGTALGISQRTGSAVGELFSRTARMVADNASMRRSLRVKTSQARLSAKVVAGMPVLLAGVLALISPDYRAGLATAAGAACLCIAAVLDLIALVCIRSLMGAGTR